MNELFTIQGVVKHGNKRGKRLGFPTLNMEVQQKLPEGIFVSQTIIDKKQYNSLTFVGAAKTYNENLFQAETYLFDFSQDVYGHEVIIHVLQKIRDNKKFESEEALLREMENDKKTAIDFFMKNGDLL